MKKKKKSSLERRGAAEIQSRKKRRKKQRHRVRNMILSILLLILAALCIAGIVYLAGNLTDKKKNASEEILTGSENSTQEDDGTALEPEKSEPEDDTYGESEKSEPEDDTFGKPDESAAVEETENTEKTEKTTIQVGDVTFHGGFSYEMDENTVVPPDTDVLSSNSILIDLSTDRVIAAKDAQTRIYPASMTKILTVLVAAEHVTNLDDTFTMTSDITGYCLTQGCSAAGFVGGEVIPVRDLFYGTILPSGGEAAVGLATYVAGSQEAFVELMNKKLEELGLSDTAHFTNCVGIYNDDHYCTVADMAMILKAAVENDFCREVLSAHVYYTTKTEQNPEGIILSNWFLRRIEDKDCGGEVLCAKTGFVAQSGDCAASYEISAGGIPYICVTVNTYSSWRCIYDHVAMYKMYAK